MSIVQRNARRLRKREDLRSVGVRNVHGVDTAGYAIQLRLGGTWVAGVDVDKRTVHRERRLRNWIRESNCAIVVRSGLGEISEKRIHVSPLLERACPRRV